jgi:hypothetical protein
MLDVAAVGAGPINWAKRLDQNDQRGVIAMVISPKPHQRFAKSWSRRARRHQLAALLDATWDQHLDVMLYLVDR